MVTWVSYASNLSMNAKNEFNQSQTIKFCPEFPILKKQLNVWTITALRSTTGLGCPSNSLLSKLETIAFAKDICSDEAISSLLATYVLISSHPNYAMCGLWDKAEVLIAKTAIDGKVCTGQPINKIQNCFYSMDTLISNLKIKNNFQLAFDLGKKTANSNDVTGLSQMIVGMMYYYGEGTEKNIPLAIKFLKEAAIKLDGKARVNTLIALAIIYEELKDYKNAKNYASKCAIMGDNNCKIGFERLTSINAGN